MKQRKRITKSQKGVSLQASAKQGKRSRYLPSELEEFYKPIKRPVTLRLDADVLAWFQRGGAGYQTRINRALRRLMTEERKQ